MHIFFFFLVLPYSSPLLRPSFDLLNEMFPLSIDFFHLFNYFCPARPGPQSLPNRELHPDLYRMPDQNPPLLCWLRSTLLWQGNHLQGKSLFYGRETICKGRVSKSSPEMRGRGMVSTGFSSRSCPLFTEVLYRGEQKN